MDAQTREALGDALTAATPSYLAKALLDLREGEIRGLAIINDGETLRVSVEDFETALRAEMERRLKRSAAGKGDGT